MGERAFNVLSLCAGAGGLDLGVSLACESARTVCYVEHEGGALVNLVARMAEGTLDDAPVWTDLRTFDGRPWRGVVDCVIGGYPCQPFSVAGKRRGTDDPRHLWPHVFRIVDECRPDWCFFENVGNHLRLGYFDVVRPDLEGAGYRVAEGLYEAAEVGATHKRERLFIMAHRPGVRAGEGREQPTGIYATGRSGETLAHRSGWHDRGRDGEPSEVRRDHGELADARRARRQQDGSCAPGEETGADGRDIAEHPSDGAVGDTASGQADRRGRNRMARAQRSRRGSNDASDAAGEAMGDTDGGRREQRVRSGEWRETEPSARRGEYMADTDGGTGSAEHEQQSEDGRAIARSGGDRMADAERAGLEGRERGELAHAGYGRLDPHAGGSGLFPPGPDEHDAWRAILERWPGFAPAIESDFRDVADGLAGVVGLARAYRTNALRLTGNGVVPLQAAYAWRTLRARFEE